MINLKATVRPEERRLVFGATITLFGILAGHALLETARDALFLGRLPASQLPWVYLLIAVTSVGLMQWQARYPIARSNRLVLAALVLGSGAVTAALWALLGAHSPPWVLYLLYVWAGVFATMVVTRFWLVVEDVFTVTQAKRVFAIIGAGSVLGAIVGSGLARGLSEVVDPRHFLLFAAGILGLTGLLPMALLHTAEETRGRDAEHRHPSHALHWKQALRTVLHRPYVKRLLGLVVVSTIALTFVDYLFKSIVARQLEGTDLASFFATTYLALNLLSLLFQLTLVSVLLRSFGLNRVLGLTPMLLALGAGLLMIVYTTSPLILLVPALALKAVDGSLRHSLHRTSIETLYVPLSRTVREQVKTFVDVLGQRGGQALASLVILVVVAFPGSEMVLAAGVIALSVSWIRLARDIRRHYLDLFRTTLSEREVLSEVEFPELDLASLEKLIERLNSVNDAEVVAAMDMLAEQDRVHLIPALILYHPSKTVVTRALHLFARTRREEALPILERIADHEDAVIRAGVLRARAILAPDVNRQLSVYLDDPSPVVRATALVTLVAEGWIEGDDAATVLRTIAKDADDEEALALVLSIQEQPHPIHTSLLIEFAQKDSREVRRETAIAMRAVGSEEFIDPLIGMLPVRDVRSEARSALVSIGEAALEALDRALGDEALAQNVRRHVPRTISRFEPELAAPILMRHLLTVRDGLVRFKILRGLGALRRRDRDLDLDGHTLRKALELTLAGAFRLLDWRGALREGARSDPRRATAVHELLLHTLEHKEAHARERMFRLLDLLFPEEDWQRIYNGLESDRAEDHASAHELIAATLEPPLRDGLLGFVDDLSDDERLRLGLAFYTPRPWTYEETLASFLEQGSLGMRCITIHHIGELGLTSFRDALLALRDEPPVVQQQVVARALVLLDQPETELLGHE
jgi:AAA family ATP:ADP antiporter